MLERDPADCPSIQRVRSVILMTCRLVASTSFRAWYDFDSFVVGHLENFLANWARSKKRTFLYLSSFACLRLPLSFLAFGCVVRQNIIISSFGRIAE